MVQVDVFWAYGLGAGFAIAACRQLKTFKPEPHRETDESWYSSSFLTTTILFMAILFAPSGVCLLWAFPSWETMHVADRNLSVWLVALFAVTNVTQGLLGYWVVYKLIQQQKRYLAFLQAVAGYFFMFFILVHGWDGTGYKRFFSATKADFINWELINVLKWLVSDVAIALAIMGVVIVPVLFYIMTKWLMDGYKIGGAANERTKFITRVDIGLTFVKAIMLAPLVLAIAASLLIHLLGWLIGLLVFVVVAYVIALRKGGVLYKLADSFLLPNGEL